MTMWALETTGVIPSREYHKSNIYCTYIRGTEPSANTPHSIHAAQIHEFCYGSRKRGTIIIMLHDSWVSCIIEYLKYDGPSMIDLHAVCLRVVFISLTVDVGPREGIYSRGAFIQVNKVYNNIVYNYAWSLLCSKCQ